MLSTKMHFENVHEKLLRYPCDKCDKRFSQLSNMKTHIKTVHHIGEESYQCDYCGKSFKTTKAIKKHAGADLVPSIQSHSESRGTRMGICVQ